jgi:hypothetical protein
MAKLYAHIDISIDFGPIEGIIMHKQRTLKAHEIQRFVEKSKRTDYTLAVSFLDKVNSWPAVGFELTLNQQEASGIFEWIIDEESGIAHVKAHGEFESSQLRPGASQYIDELGGPEADLCLGAFHLKHGKWKGFEAPVCGQRDAPFHEWLKIKTWRIK